MANFKVVVECKTISEFIVQADDEMTAKLLAHKRFLSEAEEGRLEFFLDAQEFMTIHKLPVWMPQDHFKYQFDEALIINKNQPIIRADFFYKLTKKVSSSEFYQNIIKSVPQLRSFFIRLHSFSYFLSMAIRKLFDARKVSLEWIPLVSLKDFLKEKNISPVVVFNSSEVKTHKPKIYPVSEYEYLTYHEDSYKLEPVGIAKINNANIYGGSNIIFSDNSAICHDLINIENDLLAEEYIGFCEIDVSKKLLRLRNTFPDKIDNIPIAASFIDACAPNYAHWLTETLPKLAVFCAQEAFKDIPIIVNQFLHDNIMESLAAVAKGRKIYLLPKNKHVFVESLYLISSVGYVPFDQRKKNKSSLSGGLFNPYALNLLLDLIFNEAHKFPNVNYPKKIYVRRSFGSKKIKNGDQLENLLHREGFLTVEMESFTFLQQVLLFSNAEKIICSSGSALSNLIFAKPDCEIRVPIIKHRHANYCYWQNIACACGNSVVYLLGDEDLTSSDVHSDFSFDFNLFMDSNFF